MRRRAVAATLAVLGLAGGAVPLMTAGRDGTAAAASSAAAAARKTQAVTKRDLVQKASIDGTLGYGTNRTIGGRRSGTLTWVAPAGALVTRGGSQFSFDGLYAVDGRVVPVLYGTLPMWRPLALGVDDGEDVRQLEQNLVDLGFADPAVVTVDDHFSSATEAAVKRWQDSLGWDRTGTVDPGDVTIVDGPVRVADDKATVGDQVGPSAPVVEVSGTGREVALRASLDQRALLHVGDAVSVVLPDDRRVAGHVAEVGRTATSQGDGAPAVDVRITLDDGAAVDLDAAPVKVEVSQQAAKGVLAVPVAALLALAEGGYGVEVATADGGSHLVGVQLGMFADGWVEVTGDVKEGDQVVVPT